MAAVDKDMVDRKLVQHMLMKTVNLVNHFQKEEEPLKMQEKLLILKLLKNTKSWKRKMKNIKKLLKFSKTN